MTRRAGVMARRPGAGGMNRHPAASAGRGYAAVAAALSLLLSAAAPAAPSDANAPPLDPRLALPADQDRPYVAGDHVGRAAARQIRR